MAASAAMCMEEGSSLSGLTIGDANSFCTRLHEVNLPKENTQPSGPVKKDF